MSDTYWHFGFGRRQIRFDEDKVGSLYIAGYNNGVRISGVLDYCEARAVWLDAGGAGVLLIGIDCVALDSGTVEEIRNELTDIPDCMSVNVYSTHTHAGPDTLGLWGRIGFNGKIDRLSQRFFSTKEPKTKLMSRRYLRPGSTKTE